MQLPVAVYVIISFFKDSRWYFYGWLFCLFCAAAHISFFQNLFAGFSDESGNAYLTSTDDWGGKSGFRIDFVIYSAMPVLMGYYVIFKYELRDRLYEDLLHYYLTTNGIWMLCMYGAFTNRIAYLSWFSYPFLIIYLITSFFVTTCPPITLTKYIPGAKSEMFIVLLPSKTKLRTS